MLHIYLCDDVEKHLQSYKKIIENFLLFKDWEVQIVSACTSPYELLAMIKDASLPGLYFLDVDFKQAMDGFELGARIRELDPRCFIVYITTHAELQPFVFQYHLEAMSYILKDHPALIAPEICKCVEQAYERTCITTAHSDAAVILHLKNRTIPILEQDIICIEIAKYSHQIKVITSDSIYLVCESLNEIEKQLGNDFFRCHKSCLINLSHVCSIDKHEKIAYLTADNTAIISCRNMKPLLAHLTSHSAN